MFNALTQDLLELTAEAKGMGRPAFAIATACCSCCSCCGRPPKPL